MIDKSDDLLISISKALSQHIEKIKEEVITEAKTEFEKRLRRTVGSAAIDLATMYSVERLGPELVIRVKVENVENQYRQKSTMAKA